MIDWKRRYLVDGIGLMCFAMSFETGTRADTGISLVVFTVRAAYKTGSEDEDFMILLTCIPA